MRQRGARNRTLTCSDAERERLNREILRLAAPTAVEVLENRLIGGDVCAIGDLLPPAFVDLLVLDPPYNLSKDFNGNRFRRTGTDDYRRWFCAMLDSVRPALKSDASIYVCADWRTSAIVQPILESAFKVRNRITWEREKGRGAKANWKNTTEDIWFCTVSSAYYFNVDAVKLKRRVIAPYREGGSPKDWMERRSPRNCLPNCCSRVPGKEIWSSIRLLAAGPLLSWPRSCRGAGAAST